MKKERKSFVMSLDWYDDIKDLDRDEAGWLLFAIYEYLVNGVVSVTEERHLKSLLRTMTKYFDYNEKKYKEQTIQNKLNQDIRWAKERGDTASVNAIKEKSRFLKTHSIEEYMSVYERIQPYTDNDNDSDIDCDSDNDNDPDYENEIDYENENEVGYEGDSEGVQRERKPITLEQLKKFCSEQGYSFDCEKAFRAKTKPLYEDELISQCNFWESLPR